MSCSVMVPMRTGHNLQPFRTYSRPVRQLLRIVRPASPGIVSSAWVPPLDPPSSCPPRRREAAPCFARIACACVRARLRAFRGGAIRAPDCARGGAPGTPAICHGMSCFPCAPGMSYSRFGHTAAMSGRCSGSSVRPPPASHLRHGFLLSIHLRPALPAAGKRRPVSRVSRARACAPGCARFAAARYARLIAREAALRERLRYVMGCHVSHAHRV